MKTLMGFVSLLLVSSLSVAHAVDPLESDMKRLGDLFTQIHDNLSDPAQSKVLAQDAAEMVQIFTDASNRVPDTISALPANQQAAALTEYKDLLAQEIASATDLANAFLHGDLVLAQATFLKMNQIKKSGHNQFKPPKP